MNENCQNTAPECPGGAHNSKKSSPDTEEKIYRFLDAAEKLARKLAKLNKKRKAAAKKQLKKDKKIGKIDKNTGALILKKQKPQKVQKPQKRYKAPKK